MADDKTDTKDAAPKRSGSSSKRSGSSGGRRPRRKTLHKELGDLFGLLGTGVMLLDEYDGTVILENAERMGKELDRIARENASVQRVLERLVSTSQWGSVLGVFGAVAVPIAARHGLVPQYAPALIGVTPPEEIRPIVKRDTGTDDEEAGEPAPFDASSIDLSRLRDVGEPSADNGAETAAATSDA